MLDTEPVDDAPILDLRIRKGVRRNRVQLAVATSRPSSLDPNAVVSVRYAPGRGAQFAAALGTALSGDGDLDAGARAAGTTADDVRGVAEVLRRRRRRRDPLGRAPALGLGTARPRRRAEPRAAATARACSRCPRDTNGARAARGGLHPVAGPGYAETTVGRHDAGDRAGRRQRRHRRAVPPARRPAARAARPGALGARPRTRVDGHRARRVPHRGAARARDRRLPRAVARREGGHGRAPRRPAAAPPPGDRPPGRQPLRVAGHRRRRQARGLGPRRADRQHGAHPARRRRPVLRRADASTRSAGAASAGTSATPPRRSPPSASSPPASVDTTPAPEANGRLRLGTFRSIWAAPEVEVSPALKFLAARQRAELSPQDAQRLGVQQGQKVTVGVDGTLGQGHGGAAQRRCRPARSSSRRTPPRTAPTRSTAPSSWRCARRDAHARRRRRRTRPGGSRSSSRS